MESVRARRYGTGLSCPVRVRLKKSSFESVETRLSELEMNLSDYVRELIRADIGVNV